jgi:hypothetical protein
MPDLRIFCLHGSQVDLAFPMVRSAADLTPQRWRSFARELIAAGGGIVAAATGNGCLHGLAVYRRLGTLRHGLALQVELLVAFELSRPGPVREALCAALEGIARAARCRAIVYTAPARSHHAANLARQAGWEKMGARMETVDFVRRLSPDRRADVVAPRGKAAARRLNRGAG